VEIIDVTVLVFPDGGTYHHEGRLEHAQVSALLNAWRDLGDNRQRHADAGTLGAVCFVRMFREDYLRIPATSLSAAITAAAGL
jgi:hypothetical protein